MSTKVPVETQPFDLILEDGVPMDSPWHRSQMELVSRRDRPCRCPEPQLRDSLLARLDEVAQLRPRMRQVPE